MAMLHTMAIWQEILFIPSISPLYRAGAHIGLEHLAHLLYAEAGFLLGFAAYAGGRVVLVQQAGAGFDQHAVGIAIHIGGKRNCRVSTTVPCAGLYSRMVAPLPRCRSRGSGAASCRRQPSAARSWFSSAHTSRWIGLLL